MASVACYYDKNRRDRRVQKLKAFKHKPRVCFLKQSVSISICLNFKWMIKFVSIFGILYYAADRIDQIDEVELERIRSVQFWTGFCYYTL